MIGSDDCLIPTAIELDNLKVAWADLCTHCVPPEDRNYMLCIFAHLLDTHLQMTDAWATDREFLAWFASGGAIDKRSGKPLRRWWRLRG
jgi:hypothetical protein